MGLLDMFKSRTDIKTSDLNDNSEKKDIIDVEIQENNEDTINKVLFIETFASDKIKSGIIDNDCKLEYYLNDFKEVIDKIIKKDDDFLCLTGDLYGLREYLIDLHVYNTSRYNIEKILSELLCSLMILHVRRYEYSKDIMRTIFQINKKEIEQIDWKLDALKLYLNINSKVKTGIISNNQDKIIELKNKKNNIEEIQNKERILAKEQWGIEEAKSKLIEHNRKREIKAKAKKQIELQSKIESYELYGEILYKGKMYTVKSRTDIINLLNQIKDGII